MSVPNPAELVTQLRALVDLYRELANATNSPDLTSAGFSLVRALADLDHPTVAVALERAAAEITDAREMLLRIRSVLGR
jgi:hypothetical protein